MPADDLTIDRTTAPATTTEPLAGPARAPEQPSTGRGGVLRRVTAIARAEVTLLARNHTVLATALVMGPLMAMVPGTLLTTITGDGAVYSTYVISVLLSWCAMTTVFYNLTSIIVTRREERVFKRMATGEASPWEALAAAAIPSTAVFLVQLLAGSTLICAVMGVPALPNPLLVLLALVGVVAVSVLLAAVCSTFTGSVEAAQYSTLPVFMVLVFTSGTSFPFSVMPEALQRIASLTPLNAAVELISLGLQGSTLLGEAADGFLATWSPAAQPLLVLAVWGVLSWVLAQRTVRFEPRR